MRYLRESKLVKGFRTTEMRKTAAGSFRSRLQDIYKQKLLTPHAEMEEIMNAYEQDSFFKSAVETSKDFILGEDFEFESEDESSKKMVEIYWESLEGDLAFSMGVQHTILAGNGYLEKDFYDLRMTGGLLVPSKVYSISDPSQIYINSDMYGNPLKSRNVTQNGVILQEDLSEYYIQKVDPTLRHANAKMYTLSYHGSESRTGVGVIQIYGIPIDRRKITHFKLNIGVTGLYGRSLLASSINDHEMLFEMERAIATIAKYKAVPRKIYQYGNEKMPATGDDVDELILYLQSLEPEEDAILNKPVSATDMSYSGGEINLDYALQHTKKKLIAGVSLDFLSGMGQDVNRATATQELLAYILAIYSKRKLFLKIIQKEYIDPYIKWKKLKPVKIKFPQLDFETKTEKESRIRANFQSNMITFNEMRESIGKPKFSADRKADNMGDMLYSELQNSFLPDMNFEGGTQPQPEQSPFEAGQPDAVQPPEFSQDSFISSESSRQDPTGTRDLRQQMAYAIRQTFANRLNYILNGLETHKESLQNKIVTEASLGINGVDMIMEGLQGVTEELRPTVMSILMRTWQKAGEDAAQKMNLHPSMLPYDRRVFNMMVKNSLGFIEKYATGQEAALRLTLTNGITQGDSVNNIAKEIRDHFKLTAFKSEQIARTEVVKAYNEGAKQSYKAAGVKRYKWITAGDERVRHSHEPLNGRIFEFGQKGTISYKGSDGKIYEIPASPIPGQLGDPAMDINCRCSIVGQVDLN